VERPVQGQKRRDIGLLEWTDVKLHGAPGQKDVLSFRGKHTGYLMQAAPHRLTP